MKRLSFIKLHNYTTYRFSVVYPLKELAKHDAREAVDKGLDFKEELRHRFGGQFFERIYY